VRLLSSEKKLCCIISLYLCVVKSTITNKKQGLYKIHAYINVFKLVKTIKVRMEVYLSVAYKTLKRLDRVCHCILVHTSTRLTTRIFINENNRTEDLIITRVLLRACANRAHPSTMRANMACERVRSVVLQKHPEHKRNSSVLGSPAGVVCTCDASGWERAFSPSRSRSWLNTFRFDVFKTVPLAALAPKPLYNDENASKFCFWTRPAQCARARHRTCSSRTHARTTLFRGKPFNNNRGERARPRE